MADNINVKDSVSGADVPVATDDIGGAGYQRIKAGWGADGVFVETADADGVRFPVGGLQLGTLTETAPASDTASSGLNGRLQRIAQRLTLLLAIQAPATAAAAASGTADVQIVAAATSLRLVGLTAKESAGSPASASFVLRHGTSTAGTPLVHVNLGAGESVRDWFGPGGMVASSGVYLDRLTGTTDVTVHTVVAP